MRESERRVAIAALNSLHQFAAPAADEYLAQLKAAQDAAADAERAAEAAAAAAERAEQDRILQAAGPLADGWADD